MKQTVTAQYRIYVEDKAPFIKMAEAYRDACNHVSEYVFSKGRDRIPSLRHLHDELYRYLRTEFSLKSQMAQSVMRTVIARYSTLSTLRRKRNAGISVRKSLRQKDALRRPSDRR